MPTKFVPSRSSAHRLACLSLYKSLLRRCNDLQSRAASSSGSDNKSSSTTLRALVRYRFKHDKTFQNWQQIRNALQFGRGALQLLERASAGSYKALEDMSRIISTSTSVVTRNIRALQQIKEEQSERQMPRKFRERKERELYLADKSHYQRNPDITPVFERPVPYEQALKHKDGRRKVPDYFVVGGIPFLRYTRRHPLAMSQYIGKEMKKHDSYWTKSTELDNTIALSTLEDDWEAQLWKDHKYDHEDTRLARFNPDRRFADPAWSAWRDLQAKKRRLDNNQVIRGEKLWEIFLKEEALAKSENAARKEENRRKWNAERAKDEAEGRQGTKEISPMIQDRRHKQEKERAKEAISDYKPMVAEEGPATHK